MSDRSLGHFPGHPAGIWWRLPKGLEPIAEGGLRLTSPQPIGKDSLPWMTVVTVTLNALEGLRKTRASILALGGGAVEHVVVDGVSTDGTLSYLREEGTTIDYWVSAKDLGIYDAMNRGIHLARGTWVMFINAGDTLEPSIQRLQDFDPSQFALVQGWTRIAGTFPPRILKGRIANARSWLVRHQVCHQALAFNGKDLRLYRSDYLILADRVMVHEVLSNSPRAVAQLAQVVCTYEGGGLSHQRYGLLTREWVRFAVSVRSPLGFLSALGGYVTEMLFRTVESTRLYRNYRNLRSRLSRSKGRL